MRIYIKTNGCPRRDLDISRLARYFTANGCEISSVPDDADYIFFVTCAFRKLKEDVCFELIDKFARYKAELVILGCLPSIAPERLKKRFSGKKIATKEMYLIDDLFKDFKVKFSQIPDANQFYPSNTTEGGAYLRISNGCYGKCSYCAVHRAIGKFTSKPIDTCVSEYKELLRKGCRNFTILADNVGAYGTDIGSTFTGLLTALSDADKGLKVYWHIQGLHPYWGITYRDALSEWVKGLKINWIGCPVQSGSDRILKLMNREHSISDISEILIEFKRVNPKLRLETDIIIGFPSETTDEFYKTLEVVKAVNFDKVWIYPYYDATDTPASRMAGQKIDKREIRNRLRIAAAFLKKEKIENHCLENETALGRFLGRFRQGK